MQKCPPEVIRAERKIASTIVALERAHDKLKVLSGIVPICMHCKQVKNDESYWKQLEAFIASHSSAQFSHSICETGYDKHYPEED